ncbi:MAG TPA: 3-isopropylmalate dehydrogenase [Patescibacteria group bacterium]|nr:3-isopropylmalate dehydrogenase [Patescibacteria group bacterium]
MSKHLVVIPGDGIGPEITKAALAVLLQAAQQCGLDITYEEQYAGGAAIDYCGVPLPEATLAACGRAQAVLLGAVGGPKWDTVAPELRPEKAILGLRKALKLYANLRPVRVNAALAPYSPLKTELAEGVDILIVRELNGGIYYGPRSEAQMKDGREEAWDTEIYSAPEVEKIVLVACQAAAQRRRRITSVDKANVLASSRLWRKTAASVAARYPELELQHMYIDNCAMQLVLNPKGFDVLVTGNLFGDIISDEAAVLAGSIGMLPSASLGDGPGLYEPIHGSAPDIAGQDIANPLGTILSAAMLLRHSFDAPQAAARIEQAVDAVLADGYATADLYRPGLKRVSTAAMGRLVQEKMR